MSYFEDFRKQVLSHIDMWATTKEVSKLFFVSTSSIKRWKRNRRETGKVMEPGRPKKPYKIDDDKLKQYIKANPDTFLEEIANYFGVTSPGIFAALKRLKITRKNTNLYKERCEKKRSQYFQIVDKIP